MRRASRLGSEGGNGAARPASKRRRGFTLAELLVVIAGLGVLVAALLPSYRRGVLQARRTEAYAALGAIHDAQVFYFAKEGEYSDSFAELGLDLDGGALRPDGAYEGRFYVYSLDTWDLDGRANANYRATATGNIDATDDTLDIVIIENALKVLD